MNKIPVNILPFIMLAFASGIYSGEVYPAEWTPVFLYAATFVAVIASVCGLYCRKMLLSFNLTLLLFFIIGMIAWIHAAYLPAGDISRFAGEQAVIEGIVDDAPQYRQLRTDAAHARYIMKVVGISGLHGDKNKNTAIPASGRIQVNIYYKKTSPDDLISTINYGDKISVFGKIAQIRAYNNPGRMNASADMKRQGISAVVNVKKEELTLLASAENKNSWRQQMTDWQNAVINTMKKRLPDNDRGILSAMIFGKSDGIANTVLKNFSTTGLIHILSVSGAHIAIVAGFLNWLGLLLRLPVMPRAFLAMAGILLYAVVSGLSPPVIRASVMGAISIMAVVFGREKNAAGAISIAALVMLAFSPPLLYNTGFQLSFSSTAGIIFLYRPTREYLSFLPNWLRDSFAVTITAQLGCLPFMAWYFNNFSLVSLLSNLIVLPLIEIVLILGLIGTAVHALWPLAAGITFIIAGLFIGLGVELTSFLAKTPGAVLYLPPIGVLGGIIYYCFLFRLYNYKMHSLPELASIFKYAFAKKSGQVALLGLSALLIWHVCQPKPLVVHFLDVGQGDCTLVATPAGKAVLIDTGGTFDDSASFDVGERIVVPYLKHYGLKKIDYLILTHGHQDHAGGAAGIAANMTIDNIILAKEKYSPAVENLLRAAPAATIIPAYTGQKFTFDGVSLNIELAGEVTETPTHANEISSVVRISYGTHSFLITGDLESQGEAVLLEQGFLPATVLKVGHHGSKTSSGEDFLRAVSPRYAVISVGYNNRFGHPHPGTLKRLIAQNAEIYRTDENGAVVFFTNGKNIRTEPFHADPSLSK